MTPKRRRMTRQHVMNAMDDDVFNDVHHHNDMQSQYTQSNQIKGSDDRQSNDYSSDNVG